MDFYKAMAMQAMKLYENSESHWRNLDGRRLGKDWRSSEAKLNSYTCTTLLHDLRYVQVGKSPSAPEVLASSSHSVMKLLTKTYLWNNSSWMRCTYGECVCLL